MQGIIIQVSRFTIPEGKLLTRVHDHHTIMSIAKDVEFIFKVSEEKSTLIASLDVGLKVRSCKYVKHSC